MDSDTRARVDVTLGSKAADHLLTKIRNKTARIGVVGLGYVGLPLIWTFHREGFQVVGYDIDQSKVDHITAGTSYIKHFGVERMRKLSASNHCEATTDFSRVPEADVLLLCVPTPLNAHREPDMSYVENTVRTLGPYLREGQLLVLESTTYPGTTEELIVPPCEQLSGLKSGETLFIAYSPEREDPGNPSFETSSIPKVVGGEGADALLLATELYDSVIDQVVPVSNTRTAEAVKLLENIFRAVNIALVNELKVVFQEMGIDIYEVVDAAKTKPFGFMPFYPGPGLGGHCIPIDPFYLTWKAREYGLHTRFIELAGEINTAMPAYVVRRSMEALNERGKALKGSKVLCVGLAYKPDVDDMRESPTFAIMDALKSYGAEVHYYDPYIPIIPGSREHADWAGLVSVKWDAETLSQFDLAVILTKHSGVDHAQLPTHVDCVVDTRNALPGDRRVFRA
ncbi:MAG: UDP-N-acetyl-D-glucosamine dehydrogenase [Rhodothermales bacterium]|jgi:UDP-N-acetyl-D-glucosamine dehydrogenase